MDAPTILVIEDNALNLKLVRSLLNLDGYHVLEAEDAEHGIELAVAHKPDLILMDIQLPGMDGLTATRRLKARQETRGIPVVALTGFAMTGDDVKAREAGCDGYITKPIDTRTFREALKRFLNQPCRAAASLLPPAVPKSRPRILIVDDEPLNVKLLTAKLPADQYEAIPAYRGEEALQIARETAPDLILLDIMMPGMNGYEVSYQLKAEPATAVIPVILVTALDEPEDKIRGYEAGADEFLNKPVNDVELLTRIRSLLRLNEYRKEFSDRERLGLAFTKAMPGQAPAEAVPARVLLVEDDERDMMLIQAMLKEGPYQIVHVRSGEEALSRLQQDPFDLLLLDVLLPGLDGFEVCRQFKEEHPNNAMQVVLITCLTDLDNKVRGMELGADDYLIKPIQGRELRARMKVLLKKKRYLDQLRDDRETAIQAAISDGMTGLYNQTYFKRFLDLEIKRAGRQKYAIGLVIMDLDDFKGVNDSLGHLVGDLVLKEIARLLKGNVREIDLPARYGGDEFAVVLPYAAQVDVGQMVGRLQTLLAQWSNSGAKPAGCPPITLSIGVAFYPDHGTTSEALIRKADEALYQAKNEGKNRCYFLARGSGEEEYPET